MGWQRGQAYSQDLRDRVVAAIGEPIRSVAARLAVSPSYVSKVQSKTRNTGQTTAGPQRNHTQPRLAPIYAALRARVAQHADATIAELRAWAAREHGIAVSHPVMWHTLRRLGLTLKKSASGRPSRITPTSPRHVATGRPCNPSSMPPS